MHIIGYIIVGIIFVAVILVLVLFGIFILLFNHRPCPHCSHSMEYKGEKQHTDGDIYLFHCPKCGAWDEVPKAELDARFYDWMSDINIM